MSYQDHHHPLYDDYQSRHYSQQHTYQNQPPVSTRSHFQSDGTQYYPMLDHVPQVQNVSRRSHLDHDSLCSAAWDDGRTDGVYLQQPQQELYRTPPHVDLHNFVAPPGQQLEWSAFDSSSNLASTLHLYGQYPNQPTAIDPFCGDGSVPRMTLAGSLDPSTGIFYRTPEHPRLRTAQACEKCRTRKAKCSGEHPSCKRCTNRGLVCEYAKEGRVRGPNKPKIRPVSSKEELVKTDANLSRDGTSSVAERGSPSSDTNIDVPFAPNNNEKSSIHRRNSLSMEEHRSSRPRPPNLRLESASNLYRLEGHRSSPFVRGSLGTTQRKQRLHQQLTTTTPLQSPEQSLAGTPASYLLYGERPMTHGKSSSSSTSSLGDIYGHMRSFSREPSFRDQRGCGEGGSISNPSSAVSSTFDLRLVVSEACVSPGNHDYRGDDSSYHALRHLTLETAPQQHAVHSNANRLVWDIPQHAEFSAQYAGDANGSSEMPSSMWEQAKVNFANHAPSTIDSQLR